VTRGRAVVLVVAVLGLASGCRPAERTLDFRQQSTSYSFRISSEPQPPRARERTLYKVVVRDRQSAQPIEGGEGRIFGTSRDGTTAWDSFTAGPEIGTYYATLNFVTAGDWPMAIQFRSDSTKPLERVDWMQSIFPERGSP
jgi:hypothetical protein